MLPNITISLDRQHRGPAITLMGHAMTREEARNLRDTLTQALDLLDRAEHAEAVDGQAPSGVVRMPGRSKFDEAKAS